MREETAVGRSQDPAPGAPDGTDAGGGEGAEGTGADARGDGTSPDSAIVAAARAGEPDRYLAALLAPARTRAGLLALAAFLAELRRAVAVVREPRMGEIRLQWWREALRLDPRLRSGSPIADALRGVMHTRALPEALLQQVIDARWRDLDGAPLADEGELACYLWRSEGVPFQLAAHLLGARPLPLVHAAAADAGRAYGLARLLRDMPHALAHGRPAMPASYLQAAGLRPEALLSGQGGEPLAGLVREILADIRRHHAAARQRVAKLPPAIGPAFLPVALVPTYVRCLERAGLGALRGPRHITPLTRIARMAAARLFGV
jgi:phytoene synthase